MKRALLLAAAIFLVAAAVASAQTPPPGGSPTSTQPAVGRSFVDADGDGICDHFQNRPAGQGRGQGRMGRRGGWGPRDGTGNQGVGPRDGTGYGPGARGGNCDGTGPKGPRGRGPRS